MTSTAIKYYLWFWVRWIVYFLTLKHLFYHFKPFINRFRPDQMTDQNQPGGGDYGHPGRPKPSWTDENGREPTNRIKWVPWTFKFVTFMSSNKIRVCCWLTSFCSLSSFSRSSTLCRSLFAAVTNWKLFYVLTMIFCSILPVRAFSTRGMYRYTGQNGPENYNYQKHAFLLYFTFRSLIFSFQFDIFRQFL